MTNEAEKRYSESAAGDVIQDYTCANATGIEKGTVVILSDPRTVSAATVPAQTIAGITAREKVALDGTTQISVYKKGYFDMVVSGSAVTAGTAVISAGKNYIHAASGVDYTSGASTVIGYAEETGAVGERIIVRLDL